MKTQKDMELLAGDIAKRIVDDLRLRGRLNRAWLEIEPETQQQIPLTWKRLAMAAMDEHFAKPEHEMDKQFLECVQSAYRHDERQFIIKANRRKRSGWIARAIRAFSGANNR